MLHSALFGYNFAELCFTTLSNSLLNYARFGYNFAVLYLTTGYSASLGYAQLGFILFYFCDRISSVALPIGPDAVTQSGVGHGQPHLALVELSLVEM